MEKIIEILSCATCNMLPNSPLESKCCGLILCEKCLTKICPICKKFTTFNASVALQKIIQQILIPCKFCNAEFSQSAIQGHYKTCSKYASPCFLCNQELKREETIEHLQEKHPETIINYCYKEHNDPVIGEKINSAGRKAELGRTGKYYCNGPIGYPCGCCNGVCGPSNGCNCPPCLKLDKEARGLLHGFSVNKFGDICKSTKKGIYCGLDSIDRTIKEDGRCGPEDGPRCEGCKVMQKNFRFLQN